MEDLISFIRWHKERGPAPKEEVMLSPDDTEVGEEQLSRAIAVAARRTAERRARFERAYMAALTGVCTDIDLSAAEHVRFASADALETVRQWDEMMAELEEG